MGQRYGGKIVTDGLVLCLDAHDAKSYAGEPTTNVVTYTNLNTGWSKGYQSNITYDEIEPPAGITSQVVGHTRGNNSGYWYSYGDYAPQVPSTVYVVSMYVKTLDSNFRIAFYTADNSETGRYWSSYITVPNDGKWHRVVWDSFTNPSNSQSDSLSFNFYYAGAINAASTKTWFCAPQMEAKSYQTPFVAGSRSATNGWVDRSGNSNSGTLTNMVGTGASHYRDGQVIMPVSASYLDFDGSNDYINLPYSELWQNISQISYDLWFNPDVVNVRQGLISSHAQVSGANNDAIEIEIQSNGTSFVGFRSTNGTFYNATYGTSLSANTWYNLTGVLSSSDIKYYLNGQLVATQSSWPGGNVANSASQTLMLARYATHYFNGKIGSFRAYNKALTAAEVLSNYNTTKGRFS